jgi:DNA repair protein RadD
MNMVLRPYQQEAVDAIVSSLNAGKMSVCVNMATATGKTATLSALAQRFVAKGHSICVVTHVQELVGQILRTAQNFMPPEDIGVQAASLGRKDPPRKFQICQIQTVGRRPEMIGPRRIMIVDELQMINAEEGQYRKVLEALRVMTPDMRLVGLSATPWRMKTGLAYGPDKLFEECVYRYGMKQGIAEGYLTPIIGKTGDKDFKVEGVAMRGGDYKPDELEAFMSDQGKVDRAVLDLVARTADRQQILVFSTGLKHSAMIADALRKNGQSVETVDGTMPDGQRKGVLQRFRDRQIRFLANANILTTGYDDTGIDGIALLRPTRSSGLLLQIAGRGLRLDPRKKDCVFLDYTGTLQYFGPLDTIEESVTDKRKGKKGQAPTKVCPTCDTVLPASATLCPTCGQTFARSLKHNEVADDSPVMSDTPITWACSGIRARPHQKQGKPMTLRLDYLDHLGMPMASEFLSISPEANLYAYKKSLKELANWRDSPFRMMGDTLYLRGGDGQLKGVTVDGILAAATTLTPPTSITTVRDGKYVRITRKEFP